MTQWLLRPDNPILLVLQMTALGVLWLRVWAAKRDHPPWAYVGTLLYLAVGLSWNLALSLLLRFDVVEVRDILYLVAPSGYLLWTAVIVFFLTDRHRVLARSFAMERQLRRAEELVETHEGR